MAISKYRNIRHLFFLALTCTHAYVAGSQVDETQTVLSCEKGIYKSAMDSCLDLENVSRHRPTYQDITKLSGQALFEAMVSNTCDQYTKLMSSKTTLVEDNCPVSGSCNTPNDAAVSADCVRNLHHIHEEASQNKEWAIQVLDSWGKVPSSLLQGNLNWLGDYDGCLKVDSTGHNLTTKFSLVRIYLQVNELSPFYKMDIFFGPGVAVGIGMCIPDTCTDSDIGTLVKKALNVVTSNLQVPAVVPYTAPRQKSWTREMILAVIGVSALVTLVVWATLYDLWVVHGHRTTLTISTGTDHITGPHGTDTRNRDFQDRVHTKEQSRVTSPAAQVLLSFSFISNWTELMSPDPEGTITCIHGLRAIAQTWLIVGHAMCFALVVYMDFVISDNSFETLTSIYTSIFGSFFSCFLKSVNVFFAISGVLVTNNQMKRQVKAKLSSGYILHLYLHRLWRLAPAFYFVLLLYVGFVPLLASGPMWVDGVDRNQCWKSVFFIHNFFGSTESCAAWTWYVSCDVQMFLVSPLVFIPLHRYGRKGLLVPVLFIGISIVTCACVSWHFNLEPALSLLGPMKILDYSDKLHLMPFTALSAFMPGMITGYLLHVTPRSYRMDKWKQWCGWLVCTVLFLGVILIVSDHYSGHPWSRERIAVYNGVKTLVWGGTTAWIIFACATGHGGFLNRVLSWKGLIPISRICYSTFLVHLVVIYYIYHTERRLVHFYATTPIVMVVLSFLLGGVITLTCEMPMADLSKTLWPHVKQLFSTRTCCEPRTTEKPQDKALH